MANNKKSLNIYSDSSEYVDTVKRSELAMSLFSSTNNVLVVCKSKDCLPSTIGIGTPFLNAAERPYSRVLILFTTLPIKLDVVSKWKSWVFDNKISEMRIDFLRIGDFDVDYIEGRIKRHCKNWDRKSPPEETIALRKGSLVDASSLQLSKDSPDLLTAMFGAMGEMIMRVRNVRERFDNALVSSLQVKDRELDKTIEIQKKAITNAMATGEDAVSELEKRLVSFPKLLLYGETGVGKTLVSRYLQSISGKDTGRPVRISIPEYIGKEEDFEYALFGYAKGAYTGGLEQGSAGLLVENMGKVVFLDEIEEANSIIQAKLLAYLDDYRVRPRGWLHNSFFCPTLVVAATNCKVEELRSQNFRKDLLARFTDIETVPPLRDRKESMDFIIDSLLQQDSINNEQHVDRIGKYALEKLKTHPYTDGNFRELEDVLRNACVSAQKDGRDYLCECDIVFD